MVFFHLHKIFYALALVNYHGLDIYYFDNPIYFLEENFVVIKYNIETFDNNANILEITEQEYNDYKIKKENEPPNPPPSDVLTSEQRIEQLEKENTTIKASMAELAELVLSGGM